MKRYFKGIVAVLSVMALLVGCSGGQTMEQLRHKVAHKRHKLMYQN